MLSIELHRFRNQSVNVLCNGKVIISWAASSYQTRHVTLSASNEQDLLLFFAQKCKHFLRPKREHQKELSKPRIISTIIRDILFT